jgi:hypothetical protein
VAKDKLTFTFAVIFFMSAANYGQAALYIDDTATVDKGHFELEFSADYYKDVEKEYDPETEEYTKTVCKETNLSLEIEYGLTCNWDVGIKTPYKFINDSSSGKINGFSDFILSTKYRLWEEKETLPSFALSFDLKTDTANVDNCLGTGKKDHTITSIFTKNIGYNVFDLNLGYIFVGGKTDDIFFYSFDVARDLTDKVNLCTEIYGETTFEGSFDKNIFCWAFSVDYQFNSLICLESGIGIGISKVSPDYQFSSTITLTF